MGVQTRPRFIYSRHCGLGTMEPPGLPGPPAARRSARRGPSERGGDSSPEGPSTFLLWTDHQATVIHLCNKGLLSTHCVLLRERLRMPP